MIAFRTLRYIALAAAGLVLASQLSRRTGAAGAETSPSTNTLEMMADTSFGPLSNAERLLVRGAPTRKVTWLGPSDDPENPSNDPAHADKWGAKRIVRGDLVRWLLSDPKASQLVHSSGVAVAGARIGGALDLSYATTDKPVLLLSCYVPDGIDLSYSHLQSFEIRRSRTGPIDADMSNISGDAAFRFGDYGVMSFFRAHLGGSLDLQGAKVMASGQDTVGAVESNIGGDIVFARDFTTDGFVDVSLASIGHDLSFHQVHFVGRAENGLNGDRAAIGGTLYWTDVAHTALTKLDLSNARAGALWDDPGSWPAKGNLDVDGFEYSSFAGGPADSAERLEWLALQEPGYKPRPFQQLAKVLHSDGRDEAAVDVLIAQREAQRRYGTLRWSDRVWNLVLDATIGYGYRPLRALWWIIGFVLIGTLLFGVGNRMLVITPTDATAYRTFVETGAVPPHYPPFNAFVYSLENFLPVVDLYQGNYWRPNPFHRPGGTQRAEQDSGVISSTLLNWYLWLHILAGWVLTPLLFAGLSGLIRVD